MLAPFTLPYTVIRQKHDCFHYKINHSIHVKNSSFFQILPSQENDVKIMQHGLTRYFLMKGYPMAFIKRILAEGC